MKKHRSISFANCFPEIVSSTFVPFSFHSTLLKRQTGFIGEAPLYHLVKVYHAVRAALPLEIAARRDEAAAQLRALAEKPLLPRRLAPRAYDEAAAVSEGKTSPVLTASPALSALPLASAISSASSSMVVLRLRIVSLPPFRHGHSPSSILLLYLTSTRFEIPL